MTPSRRPTRRIVAFRLSIVSLIGVLAILVAVWFIPFTRGILGTNQIYKAPWSLAQSVTPDATSIDLVVSDSRCGADGPNPEGRMLEPTVVYAPASMTVTVELVSNGSGDCLGDGEYPVTITLREPVGNREVLGGVPTEPIIRPRPLI